MFSLFLENIEMYSLKFSTMLSWVKVLSYWDATWLSSNYRDKK